MNLTERLTAHKALAEVVAIDGELMASRQPGYSDAKVTFLDQMDDLGKAWCRVEAGNLFVDPLDVATFIAANDPDTVKALVDVALAARVLLDAFQNITEYSIAQELDASLHALEAVLSR